MSVANDTTLATFEEAPPRVSSLKRFLRVLMGRKIVIVGIVIIVLLTLDGHFCAMVGPA